VPDRTEEQGQRSLPTRLSLEYALSLSFVTRTQRGFEGDIERENVEGDELGGSRIMQFERSADVVVVLSMKPVLVPVLEREVDSGVLLEAIRS